MSIRTAVHGVSVRLGSVQALDAVDLNVEPGQFLALLGPSGSGKTTTLNVLAGFVQPDEGTVTFDGNDVTRLSPHRRDLGIVFQGYALFPHMSVAENVGFPLRMRRIARAKRERMIRDALGLVGLSEQSGRSVGTLSGGQKQRVALARAIVFEPRMMLLDEPLAALDKQLRDSMQLELRRLQQQVGITTVAVTHDQIEALTMADVVAVMNDGHVEQVADPKTLYLRPSTIFVATFLGEANLVPVEAGHLAGFGSLDRQISGQAVIRPEHLVPREGRQLGDSWLGVKATAEEVTFQGARLRARVRLQSAPEIAVTVSQPSLAGGRNLSPGDEIELAVDAGAVHVVRSTEDEALVLSNGADPAGVIGEPLGAEDGR